MSVFRVGSNKSSVNNFPSVRPTLDLDFANSKTLDPRITFTRASGGSYTGADGLIKYAGVNEARFDHDPVTGESLGLLIEESRSNLTPYSRYADTQWTFNFVSLGDQTKMAIDGSTVTTFLTDTTTSFHRVNRTVSGSYVANELVTFSFYVANPASSNIRGIVARVRTSAGGQSVNIVVSDSGANSTYTFSSSNPFGANPPADITADNFSAINVGNNWTRISFTGAVSSVNTTYTQWDIGFSTDVATDSGAGTANSQIFIDSVQLEAGAFPTSYIPTQASTRTRDKDTAIITQNNFSWYNGTEGTILLEHTNFPFNDNAPIGYPAFGVAGTASGDSLFTIQYLITSRFGVGYFLVRNGDVLINDQVEINFGLPATGSKVSFAFKKNNFAAARNGILMGTDNLGVVPDKINVSMLIIGLNNISSNQRINCHCKYLIYYPKRLPDAQLQALTK